jgi:hypothetical protein
MTQPAPERHSVVQPCPYCNVVDRPTLTEGTGPHVVRASCSHCGRFIKWLSLLAPAERMARKVKSRLQAMQQRPPSQAQLDYLRVLGDKLGAPQNMAEASARIDALVQQKRGSA